MRMRLLFLMSIIGSVAAFASCNGYKAKVKSTFSGLQPDSAVYHTLGKTVSEILFNPSKVICYRLKGVSNVGKEDYEVESHYVRDSLVAKLNTEQISILQFNLLAWEDNYKEDSIKVRSPYVPVLEFCFEKKKQEPVHVIISFSDFSWSIMYDDKRQGNWNYAEKKLLERLCKYIVGDYIKM